MYPNLIEHLRVFLSVVDSGSLNAAARRLNKAPATVSYAVNTLESQLGVTLLDRDGHTVSPTETGSALIRDSRNLLADAARISAKAKSFASGIEPEIRIAVDDMFPTPPLERALRIVAEACPHVRVHIIRESLSDVWKAVSTGQAVLGLGMTVTNQFTRFGLDFRTVAPIAFVPVCGSSYLLAYEPTPVSQRALAQARQIVVWSRGAADSSEEAGVHSNTTWRVSDLSEKRALIEQGFGWGYLPNHMVSAGLAQGRLVKLDLTFYEDTSRLALCLGWAPTRAPGPAGMMLVENLMASLKNAPPST
ncbi:MAG: LysR family transcriptional regulator [Magnetospiraceae bacterium]